MSVATLARPTDGLRDFYGRGMNVQSDVYKLPADAEEHDRLTVQHRMWKIMLGGSGLYPPDVEDTIRQLLSPNVRSSTTADNAPAPSVLDLGSGSGIWAAEMAAMYPHAKVVGLDLTEPKLRCLFPANCSFVTMDLANGLDQYTDSFDVVHCRCVAGHVVDREQLMRDIAKVLKPGGLLLLGDGNAKLYNPDGSTAPPASVLVSTSSPSHSFSNPSTASTHKSSWLSLWLNEAIGRFVSMTLDPEHSGGEYLGPLIQEERELELIEHRTYFSPFYAGWRDGEGGDGGETVQKMEEREKEERLAKLTCRDMLNFLTSSKPALLSSGVPEDSVNDWQMHAREEIINSELVQSRWAMRWDMAWATKRVDFNPGGL